MLATLWDNMAFLGKNYSFQCYCQRGLIQNLKYGSLLNCIFCEYLVGFSVKNFCLFAQHIVLNLWLFHKWIFSKCKVLYSSLNIFSSKILLLRFFSNAKNCVIHWTIRSHSVKDRPSHDLNISFNYQKFLLSLKCSEDKKEFKARVELVRLYKNKISTPFYLWSSVIHSSTHPMFYLFTVPLIECIVLQNTFLYR